MESIEDLAQSWVNIDKDPETRQQIEQFLAGKKHDELEKRLRGRMTFGTAGLRARTEAGFTRMNCVTVIQASQGLAAYVLEQIPDARTRGVVIGHDARYNGNKFARLTAAAFVKKGIKVWWFDRLVHTPLVPFAVRELHAAVGVMVTASHNPAADQGYKVYWENACQIIPPIDRGIASAIDQNLKILTWSQDVVDSGHELVEEISTRIVNAYADRVASYVAPFGSIALLPFVYTPMHGVGLPYLTNVYQRVTRGRTVQSFKVVELQAQPDGTFPTVKFPNPEERGALDLAKQTADAANIPLIIATDPDADRLAVAEKLPDGTWHQFTGNEVGILLASYIIDKLPKGSTQPIAMLNSTVSSGMLKTMCQAHKIHHVETLTGFKWLGNTALKLSFAISSSNGNGTTTTTPQSYSVPFAFEEALGYMFPSLLPDKDGISAALVFLAAATSWSEPTKSTTTSTSTSSSSSASVSACARPMTPYQKLQSLYTTYGAHADANTYLISPSPATTAAVFEHVRSLGGSSSPYPQKLGEMRITRWRDLTLGFDSASAAPDHTPDLPVDASAQMITVWLGGGEAGAQECGKVTARGSGTEPKIKLYIECVASESEGGMQEAKKRALKVREAVLREWFGVGSGLGREWGLKLAPDA